MLQAQNEDQYLRALIHVLKHGQERKDRTGVGTISVFGSINMEFELTDDRGQMLVPIPSTKKVLYDKYVTELVWMLSGQSNVKFLLDNGVNIWNEWVIPGTEVFGRLLEWSERIRECERMGFLDEFTAYREQLANPDDLDAQDKWLTARGVHSHQLLDGELGPVYGAQWRAHEDTRIITAAQWSADPDGWEKRGYKVAVVGRKDEIVIQRRIDQLAQIEQALRNNRDSRRIILSAWNVARLDEMALPPCHTLSQWYVREGAGGHPVLDCKLYQRSADLFLGCPFNFGFYSIFTHMLANMFGMSAGKLYHTFGDAHIYSNHVGQVRQQLGRPIKENSYPVLCLDRAEMYSSITEFKLEDINISGYESHPFIKAKVAK